MDSSKALWGVLGVLLLAVALVYGLGWLLKKRPPSADDWAAAATGAGTVKERQFAAVKLSEFGKPARKLIVGVLQQSKDPEVRVACIQGLTMQWDYRSMPLFFELLNDPSSAVRLQAAEAVEYMLRRDYGFRNINGENQAAERKGLVARVQADWEQFKKGGLTRAFMREKMGEELEQGGEKP